MKRILLFSVAICFFTYLVNAQNIGIGTATPNYKTHVFDNVDGGVAELLKLQNNNTSNGTGAQIKFTLSTDATLHNAAIEAIRTNLPSSHATALLFKTCPGGCATESNMAERMRVGPEGNVGIGNVSPSFKLDVSGNARFTDQVSIPLIPTSDEHAASKKYVDDQISGEDDWDKSSNDIFNNNTGNVGVGTNAPSSQFHVEGTTAGDGTWTEGILVTNSNATAGEPTIAFQNSASGSNYWFTGLNQNNRYDIAYGASFTDGNIKFSVLESGNTGIGTTAPGSRLEVFNASSGEIGAFLPSSILRLENDSDNYIEFRNPNNTYGGIIFTDNTDQAGGLAYAHNGTTENNTLGIGAWQNITFHVSDVEGVFEKTERMRIDPDGDVGIGTTNPSATLHTNGTVRFEGLSYAAADQRLLAVDSDGNLSYRNSDEWEEIIDVDFENPSADMVWLLCLNDGGNNEIIGTLYGQRSSGYRGAASVDILISSRSGGGSDINGYINTQQVLHSNERYSLITCDYSGNSYVALRYEGQGYNFSEVYFKGLAKSDDAANLFTSLEIGNVTNVASFSNGGTKQTFNTDLVGINTNNPSSSYTLHVNGRIGSNGINETSDRRFKKNISSIDNGLDKIMQLRGVSYDWRQEEFPNRKFKEGKDLGVIAQEIEKVLPEVVNTDEEGYKSVQYSHLVPVLIEAIKGLKQEMNQMESTHEVALSKKESDYKSLLIQQNKRIERLERLLDLPSEDTYTSKK